jgi:hypothetical protein
MKPIIMDLFINSAYLIVNMDITKQRWGVTLKNFLFAVGGFLFMIVMLIVLESILEETFFSDFIMSLLLLLV